jgi:hypothetical protein
MNGSSAGSYSTWLALGETLKLARLIEHVVETVMFHA